VSRRLIPIGVFPEDFSETLLIQLDQTGALRGDIVHKSTKVSLRTIRDPFSDEMKDIDDLVVEMQLFDNKVEQLGLLSVRP
jgi:DNA-directed RNA polymerase specialized sigma54-like protein